MTLEEKWLAKAATAANIILSGAGSLSLLAFLYSVYNYGWTGQRQFTSDLGPVIYYVVPAVLAGVLFAALKLKSTRRIVLAICFFFLAVSAYGLESLLLFSDSLSDVRSKTLMAAAPVSERERVAAKLAEEFDVNLEIKDQGAVIADLRSQGVDAVPQIVLPLLEQQRDNSMKSPIRIAGVEVAPLSGIANKLTVACNQTDKHLIYETDEHGFHNPKGKWQSGSVDIAAMGNSPTFGACVPSDANFVAIIQRLHPATVNLGIPGEGAMHILAILREYALFLRPKLVLWFYSEATLFELQLEKQSLTLRRYLEDDFTQGLLERQSDIDQALTADIDRQIALQVTTLLANQSNSGGFAGNRLEFIKLGALRQRLGLIYGAIPQQRDTLSDVEINQLQPDFNLLQEVLSEARMRVSSWGGKLYFVYLPGWERLYFTDPPAGVRARQQILSIVDNLGIPVIDIPPAFQAHKDPPSLFALRAGHYSPEGHRLIAETVLNSIGGIPW